ncbi:hypothetical protein [Streptomyces regalis]|uniref:Uncharacterized protein n=1 Tax=Streptomyces regalis TaxID=68262 RepID=A0A101J6A2_9ACTN|nr:hypothetical protein [Streptomyces regalis]KUL20993.1 hypothetical protein ADL12_47020 [Streptomyces regalis]
MSSTKRSTTTHEDADQGGGTDEALVPGAQVQLVAHADERDADDAEQIAVQEGATGAGGVKTGC